VKIVAVEPKESAVLSGGRVGQHLIQGIGAGFLPTILDKTLINEVVTVCFDEAKEAMNLLARREGIPSGISSGAALFASVVLGKREAGKNIVTILPDGIEKYLTS
jgi:cysteine synthase A